MVKWTIYLWLFCASLPLVFAQFQFFDHMFGQPSPQQHRQPSGQPGQWAAQADVVPCSDYLCPETLVCVSNPSHCPCPDAQDIKCLIPDSEETDSSTVVCVRGAHECAEVERLAGLYAK